MNLKTTWTNILVRKHIFFLFGHGATLVISAILDVHMMLVGGFGFLMTFLKRFGYSALGLTLVVVVFSTEWSILLWGFTTIDASFTIPLDMMK